MNEEEKVWDYRPYDERPVSEQYKNLIREILSNGVKGQSPMVDKDGKEINTIDKMGATIRFNLLRDGAPVITERSINGFWKSAVGELLGFINGAHTQEELEEFGCKWWKAWCTEKKCAKRGLETGDLGPGSYGSAFANFPAANDLIFSQFESMLELVKNNPNDKELFKQVKQQLEQLKNSNSHIKPFNQFEEIMLQMKERPELKTHIITPWIPNYTIRNHNHQQKVVVAPCHGWIHFRIFDDGRISMVMWQRSCDVLIGCPSNWVQYSALLLAVAKTLNLEPFEFVHQISDAHIYEDQLPWVEEILSRPSHAFPTLKLVKKKEKIFDYRPDDFELSDYHREDPIKGIPVGV